MNRAPVAALPQRLHQRGGSVCSGCTDRAHSPPADRFNATRSAHCRRAHNPFLAATHVEAPSATGDAQHAPDLAPGKSVPWASQLPLKPPLSPPLPSPTAKPSPLPASSCDLPPVPAYALRRSTYGQPSAPAPAPSAPSLPPARASTLAASSLDACGPAMAPAIAPASSTLVPIRSRAITSGMRAASTGDCTSSRTGATAMISGCCESATAATGDFR